MKKPELKQALGLTEFWMCRALLGMQKSWTNDRKGTIGDPDRESALKIDDMRSRQDKSPCYYKWMQLAKLESNAKFFILEWLIFTSHLS